MLQYWFILETRDHEDIQWYIWTVATVNNYMSFITLSITELKDYSFSFISYFKVSRNKMTTQVLNTNL